MPKISVILPAYNAQLYIKEAIDSILNQTFSDFEILVYNDGSSDKTKEILDSFKNPRIIAFHSTENMGYVHWLNRGLKEAKGEYIARMDADDISLPERFNRQLQFLEAHPEIGACGTQLTIIGSNTTVNKPLSDYEIRWWFFKGTPLAHPSIMIRSSVIRENKLFYNPDLRPAEDYDMWWRMAVNTRLGNLDEVLLQYRIHGQQESTAKQSLQWLNHQTSKHGFTTYLGIDYKQFDAEWTYKLFSGLLECNTETLKQTHSFFSNLLNNRQSITYFSKQEIERKATEIILVQLNNLKSYKPSLILLLGSRIFRNALSQSLISVPTLFVKSCMFWRTREINPTNI